MAAQAKPQDVRKTCAPMAEDVSGDSPDQLGFLEASQPAPAMAVPYKVLARKYRPVSYTHLTLPTNREV